MDVCFPGETLVSSWTTPVVLGEYSHVLGLGKAPFFVNNVILQFIVYALGPALR